MIAEWARERGYAVTETAIVPDDTATIASTIAAWCDGRQADLVLTTGGTGLAPRDVTPEATTSILDRPAPGIAEILRATAYPRVPTAVLSRGVAGVRNEALVVNLPGSPGGVRDGLNVLAGLVDHAIALLTGQTTTHD